ncbi:adipor-like receptor [Aphelenchoides avenae]|nr:adipor-like receptor [Aphelenchus avenae]
MTSETSDSAPRSPLRSENDDFVSADVNEALQEARRILTKGESNQKQQDEHILDESTTVRFTRTGRTRNDPVEVFISRSTIVTQKETEEEEEDIGSYSDSDIQTRSRTRSTVSRSCLHRRAGSDECLVAGVKAALEPGLRHTHVQYRRKHDDFWRRDEQDQERIPAGKDQDEARLEVDVKEECHTEEGSHVVTKTWEARWTVTSFDMLPEWLQDNEFLRTGHRPPLESVKECFRSIWYLHTETGNIWTHLLGKQQSEQSHSRGTISGCVAFFVIAVWHLTRPDTHIQFQEKLVFSFFFIGAIICLGFSFAFHTLSCHSAHVLKIFCKLDYMGISLLIVGSFIPWIYYGFYCRMEPKVTYIAMVSVLGIGAIIVSLWDKFSESRYRPLRAGVFVSMGCSGIIPTLHFIYTDGMRRLIDENSFYWLLAMACLYIFGAFLYATRTPERFFPGKCDYWFQSHQLLHLFVVAAALTHYVGISEMAMKRLTGTCPADDSLASQSLHTEL